ncbi:MAG: sulfite exporter TauE/SafE family protein [Bacteroidetes bacterium]|nr:sulfite exporter TauE/SafE family protein [Bacteroidota bacterium]MBI3482115.1 sulfite exporter TauE/SafE family protein [Bacteroidota bacterium]
MIFVALIMGFAGSLHCIGMCSPLAMAITKVSSKALANRLLYNAGRILTYGIMGALIASIGFAFPISKYQNVLSLIMGLALIIIGFASVSRRPIPFITLVLSKSSNLLKKAFAQFLIHKSFGSIFLLGTLNGFLPCGLTFLALSYCVILPTPSEGFTFMIVFGAGTLPAMLGFTSLLSWLTRRFSFSSQRLTTSLLVISGLLLIARIFLIHLPHAHSVANGMLDILICGN